MKRNNIGNNLKNSSFMENFQQWDENFAIDSVSKVEFQECRSKITRYSTYKHIYLFQSKNKIVRLENNTNIKSLLQ